MPCEHVELPSGGSAIVCTTGRRPKCVGCGKPARLLCDWKTPGVKRGTCDAPVCASCSTKPAEGKDLCPTHGQEYEIWLDRRAEREAARYRNEEDL